MIEFKKNGSIHFDGAEIDLSKINSEEFFVANLAMEVILEPGITLEKVILPLGNLRQFIFAYFSEYYDRLKPIIEATDTFQLYSGIKIFKKITIEDGYLYNTPSIDFIKRNYNEEAPIFFGMLPICIDDNLVVIEENEGESIRKKLKTKIRLLDLLEALFEDLISVLTDGKVE